MRIYSKTTLFSRISMLGMAVLFGQSMVACKGDDASQEDTLGDEEGEDAQGSDNGDDAGTKKDPSDDDGNDPKASDDDGGNGKSKNDDKASDKPDPNAKYTYYRDAKAVLDEKCVNCHTKGQIGPFALGTYEEVYDIRKMVLHSIESGSMPPWPPRKGCKKYAHDRSLSDKQKEILVGWLKAGAPKGDPKDEKPAPKVEHKIQYNMEMGMSEAWTPRGTDENRCFLAEWPGKKTQYQKAFGVRPGVPAMLHHLLVYKVSKNQAEKFHNFDRNDAGYGYNCPGGPAPNVHPNEVQLIGDWVPGQAEHELPDGVGIRFEPGDLIIFQHHYNTAFTGAKPDKSKYQMKFVDSAERPAAASLFFNPMWLLPGMMPIPPGEKDASVSWTFNVGQNLGKLAAQEVPGISPNEPLQIHFVGPHLHQLGSKAYVNVVRPDGSKDCLLETDHYDFDWQGFFTLDEPVIVKPEDNISLRCHWDNSAENQGPMPDGTKPEPQFVSWGDRTRDEMCLLGLMVTRPEKGMVAE